MDKLKELTLREANRRREDLQKQIKEDESKLASIRSDALAEKARIDKDLVKFKEQANSLKVEILEKARPIPSDTISVDRSDNKTYKFTLSSCYSGKNHFLGLNYDTNTDTKTIYLMPKIEELSIAVDNMEMAEDFDERYDLVNKWHHKGEASAIPVELTVKNHLKRVIDSGILEFGAVIDTGSADTAIEMFLNGTKVNGVIKFERMDSVTDTNVSKQWFASFEGSSNNIRPYILSNDAIRANYMADVNLSCLPKRVKKHVPMDLRFWNETDRVDRIKVRNNLVRHLDEGSVFLPLGEETNGRFSVIKIWTPRETECYHLQVQNRGLFKVLTAIDVTNFKKMDEEITFTNSDNQFNMEDGKEATIELSDKPQFARAIDWGDCVVFENSKQKKTIKFLGAKMRDILQFVKTPEHIWKAAIIEVNKTSGQDLSNSQIDEIIEMSKAKSERNAIADKVGCSSRTVYTYQKILGYV